MRGSFGAELAAGLQEQRITHTVWMGTQHRHLPRSAFYDENREHDTGLYQYLEDQQIDEIHLAGMPLEEAVQLTARDGQSLGLTVKIIEKAVVAKDKSKTTDTLQSLEKAGIEILK